ncbi:MAG: Bacterial leucyl aminopeptidase precursor [Candidatus Brocadia sinica]|nr:MULTISPECIES: M28 family peptidase [Brocadia]KXK32924.1 MAG: Bacterial leucyl aminopeptidase precursor [Candidatus Brocadia sinica]MCK6468868.1 M28 family peptidase [Candidatus Brocadia sinica]
MRAVQTVIPVTIILVLILGGVWFIMLRMPGKRYQGPMPSLTEEQRLLREMLRKDVYKLADEIGDRNVRTNYENLCAAADFIEASLQQTGYKVDRQGYEVSLSGLQGRTCYNLEVEITGSERSGEIVVIGGHYDSLEDTPGANDNASGTAAVLALARAFAGKQTVRTLRFVTFVNEEPPYFQSKDMGSWVYVKRCRQRNENIIGMLSLETIGYYSDEKWSQNYPVAPLGLVYPTAGNFVAFVGNIKSRKLVRDVVGLFRRYAEFPSEAAALPEMLVGVGWSDQWAFWQGGYPGVMVTDTAPFRYPYYHTQEDTPDKIDYDQLAYVVSALEKVVAGLAGCKHETSRVNR